MVGGKIIEVHRYRVDLLRVWCMDKEGDECAIFIHPPTDEMPQVGDDMWWQGQTALWTPKDRRFIDRHLEKVAYSFDPREQP